MKFYLVAKHLSITIQVFPRLGDAAGSWNLPAPVPTSDDSKVVVSHDVVEQRGGILDPSSYVIQPQTTPQSQQLLVVIWLYRGLSEDTVLAMTLFSH